MRDRARRAAETEEQRQTRLQQKRSRESERLAAESEQHRLAGLERVHIHTRQALDTETPEQRDARLDRMSVRQSERLATETPEERQARLSHVTACRNERLTEETLDQREARLQADRERHRDQVTHLPLLEQSSVQSKMLKFHAHCAALEMPTCTTCCKQFPGLKVNSHSGECLSCSRDKHVPKLYSSENNMNPGPVPQQLQVNMLSSKYYSIMSMLFFYIAGFNTGGGNANISCFTNYDPLSSTTWTVWLQWTCHQLATRICQQLASTTQRA